MYYETVTRAQDWPFGRLFADSDLTFSYEQEGLEKVVDELKSEFVLLLSDEDHARKNNGKKMSVPKHVIFNDPATIIIWEDGSKTVVKCGENDTFDKEKGFMVAYLKHEFGNDNTFNKFIKKYCED